MATIIKQITAKNLGKFREFSISLDRNSTYLIGPNGAGKTWTGLYALQIALQGVAEKAMSGKNPLIADRFRVIGPAAPTAQVGIVLYDEKAGHEIRIDRKVTKSGSELKITAPEGVELTQEHLNDLFNAFMINPQEFTKLSGQEQARALGIKTDSYDSKLLAKKGEYKEINAVIRAMGTLIEPEKVVSVDFAELSKKKDEILDFNRQQEERKMKIDGAKAGVLSLEAVKQRDQNEIAQLQEKIKALKLKVAETDDRIKKGNEYINSLPQPEELKPVEGIDQQINDANETNKKALAYQQWQEKDQQLTKKREELDANRKEQEQIEADRLAYIRSFKLPFKNLRVDEEGNLLLEDKLIKEPYFSTGELMKIVPILIATTKPELQYVFIKDSNLLDDDILDEVVDYLNGKGLQLLIEVRGKSAISGKNCILLRDQQVVTSGQEDEPEALEI